MLIVGYNITSQKPAAMTNHFGQIIARKYGLQQRIRVICKKLDEAIQGSAQTYTDLLDEEIAEEGTEIGEWRMVARILHLSSKEMRLCNGPMYEAALHASCLCMVCGLCCIIKGKLAQNYRGKLCVASSTMNVMDQAASKSR